jgi:hypothetical protein
VNEQLLDAVEHAARLARLERRKARARDLRVEVARFLAENPDASANAVLAAVRGRRSEVLRLVRELRRSEKPVPIEREPPERGRS